MNTEKSLKLFVVLCKTFSTVTDIAKKDIRTYGLNLSEFAALELLYHKGRQTIQEIGKKVLLTSGSMTYVVDQLEGKGFVNRIGSEKDKRVIYVEISEEGTHLMNDIFPRHERCITDIFKSLSEEQIITLTEQLKQISSSCN